MKKRSRKVVLYTVIIVSVALLLVMFLAIGTFISICLFRPDYIIKKLPYDYVMQYILYDHIVYNGVDYYITDPDIPDYIRKGNFTVEQDCIILVDAHGVPYDEEHAEDAWIFANDPDVMYLKFNSGTYTRIKELASPCYDFQN